MKGKSSGKKVFYIKKRIYFYAVAAVLAVVLLITAITNIKTENPLIFYYSPSDSGAVVLSGDKMQRNTIPGKSVARVRYCEDKVSGAVLMSEGASYSLYAVNSSYFAKVSDNCTSDYVMANSGNTIVYVANDGFLYSYDVKSKKSEKIDENVQTISLSPDGSKILYNKTVGNITELYMYQGKNSVYIANNYIPLAVSDDATLIYVLSNDNSLYLLNTDGSVKSKLCSETDTGIFCFSKDVNTVLFSDGEYSYLSVQGKSRVRVAPGKAVPVYITSEASICNSAGNVYVYPQRNLSRLVYISADGVNNYSLYYINKDMTRTDISSEVVNYTLTDKGVIYINAKGEIYSFVKGESELLVNGASDMYASSDGKYIYYVTDNKLYSFKKGEATLLADGLSKMYMAESDRLYFIMSDYKLYSVKNGKRSDMIDENVYTCKCVDGAVYYSKNYSARTGSFELYCTENELSFRFITDGLTRI